MSTDAQRCILSIDLGTSGPKVALVADDGTIEASASRAVTTISVGASGAEQDPEEIWRAIRGAARQVLGEAGRPPGDIVGVTCASHYFSTVPVDRAGMATMNLLLWMDGRGGPYSMKIYERCAEAPLRWIEAHGMPPLPSGNDSLSHMLFIQSERPDVYERTYKFVEPMDYVTARLTGEVTANACTAFAMLLTDNRQPDSISYSDELISMSGLDRDKLPDLVARNLQVGVVTDETARDWGLAPGTAVFSGTNDTQAVCVGSGAYTGCDGGINIGTTCQVLASAPSAGMDMENAIVSMPSPIPGQYMSMAENGLGGKVLEHFLNHVAFANDALVDHSTEDAYARLDTVLAGEPAGSGGLLFLPWLAGSQSPQFNPNARGGFLNMSLETTRTRMLRAIVEGVSFNLRWLLPAVEKFAGTEFSAVRFAGGCALSDQWAQILADVTGRPVKQLAEARYVVNRATALLGFVQLGCLDYDDLAKVCRVKHVYEPDSERRKVYDRAFEQFLAAYKQNLPIFEALNG